MAVGGSQMTIDEPVHQENQCLATTGGGASTGAEIEELEKLGERIAELSAQISAATYELLAMIRDFDERGGWGGGVPPPPPPPAPPPRPPPPPAPPQLPR